ncbi:antibiotic biosynthesis monooxygenase [Actinosynnema sp. NPDC023658]|uniref:antibiotic biosynthesis monooxygenase family protein n=1 Tax=Actinosynnema sp. NPDC023658 TaxID=3155465 RepID=UPI0033E65876
MVVFVNKLVLNGAPEDLERLYRSVSDFFREQPGLLRFRLLRSRRDPAVYLNVAEWESAELFERAVRQEWFRAAARVSEVADGDPHLCEVVVSGGPA